MECADLTSPYEPPPCDNLPLMSWLRHPPHPAERLAQRLGFERKRAEFLYSELSREYRWLTRSGMIARFVVLIVWVITLLLLMPFIFGSSESTRQATLWYQAASILYTFGLVLLGGMHVSSLAKWHTNDCAIRRFIADFIDTPKCFACDYGLTGVPRGADGELRCPECTQNWPWHNRIRDPRRHMSAIDPPRQPDVRPSTGSGTAVANRHGGGQSHTPPPR